MVERQGQVALVIGGTGAIGSVICSRLAEEGADVVFTYRSNAAKAAEIAASIEGQGRTALFGAPDISDGNSIAEFIHKAKNRTGRLDTLIYAAGPTFDFDLIGNISRDEWKRVMDEDLNGGFNAMHAAIPLLRETKGSIVAVLTAAVNRSTPRDILSVVPKAGLQALVKGLAIEEGRFGVRANCVAPGFIDGGLGTAILSELGEERAARMISSIVMKRLGTADEITDAVLYLCSSRASYVTGNTLFVSGGLEL